MSRVFHFLKRVFSFVKAHKIQSGIALVVVIVLFFVFKPKSTPPIETQTATKGDVVQSLSVSGTVSSKHIAALSFLTSAKLTVLNAKKGDYVKKGQVIATLDTRTVQINLQNDLRAYVKQRNTFDQTIEDKKNQVLTDSLQRVYQDNQNDLDTAVASVQLQALANEQSYLVSPIAGYVVRADIDTPGLIVTPSNVFTVADLTQLVFNIDVDEADIGKVKQDLPVSITLDAFSDKPITSSVSNIDYASHTTSTGGTAYTVQVELPSSDSQYRIGMNGDAEITLDKKTNVLQVPITSIVDGKYVLIKNKDNSIEQKNVTIGLQSDTNAEITSGLSEGDQVVLQPTDVTVTKKN